MYTQLTNNELREECGVFGVSLVPAPAAGLHLPLGNEAAGITYNALLSLQHRGQEGAGIAVATGNQIVYHKGDGLVTDVFANGTLTKLPQSSLAIGHTRYSKKGSSSSANISPFVTDYLTGRVGVASSGCITNVDEIRKSLQEHGLNFNSTGDGEVISGLMAYCMNSQSDVLTAVVRAATQLRGAFSMVVLCSKGKLIAVRDPYGFRPLCIGKNETGMVVASESCAVECCGFEFMRDIQPGEVIVIQNGEIVHAAVELTQNDSSVKNGGLCMLEYVYFARLDSIIDELSVYSARFNLGRILAQEYPIDADIVCGIPDASREIARGYSVESGTRLVPGFVLNRYVGRSFIYPTQSQRETAVRVKLNPLTVNVKGKRIILIDDSVFRGTTIVQAVASLRSAGAKEVHLLIASPPTRFTCNYGTDIGEESSLIANRMNIDEICKSIGADSMHHISLEGMKAACTKCQTPLCNYCFTGGEHCDE